MRGGRNKFGPMYKRDRALKQQKKALIRANGLKLEAMTQVIQAMPTDLTISSAIQNIHSASKGLPLNHTALPPTDYDRSPFVTSPISMTMPPHGSLQGYQTYGHFPSRAIKSEYPDPYTSSPESIMGYSYMDSYQTSSPASIPHLILELLKCEPDEPQVQAKIMAYLQQEQANRGKHEKLNTFGLMCKMADQTLFSIVEWARSSIFFRELKVGNNFTLYCHSVKKKILFLTILYFKQESLGFVFSPQASHSLFIWLEVGRLLKGETHRWLPPEPVISCSKEIQYLVQLFCTLVFITTIVNIYKASQNSTPSLVSIAPCLACTQGCKHTCYTIQIHLCNYFIILFSIWGNAISVHLHSHFI